MVLSIDIDSLIDNQDCTEEGSGYQRGGRTGVDPGYKVFFVRENDFLFLMLA